MTFSIVATDKESKEVGFAIASCTWNAGMVCTAKAGKGAVASQAQGYFKFHGEFYEKLAEGKTLPEIHEYFKSIDENIENRQVGLVTSEGDAYAFTGSKCGSWAGEKIGNGYAVQGNILIGPEVVEAMAEAFERTEGTLVERLYAALQAGDDIGGDIRGKMSARILVTNEELGDYLDINVEDHDEPVKEVGRIIGVGMKVIGAYMLQVEVMKADDANKIVALEKMEHYLADKVDRTVVDYHSFVGDTSLELGLKEKAISSYRNVLQISPLLKRHFEEQKSSGEMPTNIVDAIFEDS
ncbi:MAG: DUF1028 domain-containing protein [Candidatus Thorarchaeota archaeon]|jgi:uncharacterized Ntn-hydrolase superfamily protein